MQVSCSEASSCFGLIDRELLRELTEDLRDNVDDRDEDCDDAATAAGFTVNFGCTEARE